MPNNLFHLYILYTSTGKLSIPRLRYNKCTLATRHCSMEFNGCSRLWRHFSSVCTEWLVSETIWNITLNRHTMLIILNIRSCLLHDFYTIWYMKCIVFNLSLTIHLNQTKWDYTLNECLLAILRDTYLNFT